MIRSRLAAPLGAALRSAGAVVFTTMFFANAEPARADDETGVLSARHKSYESPQNFAIELRLGPYHPRVDTAPELGASGPYQAIFQDSLRWEFAVEFDWQAYRIPHFGTIGPGVSAGYTSSSALAPFVHPVQGNLISGESTSLTIFPTYAVAVLRIDVLSRELHVPFVPYLKGGLGLAFWEASNTVGVSHYAPTNGKGTPTGPSVAGEGHTYGEQLAIGMAIDLNFLDRRTSQGFDNATGVNHTFIFGELQDYNLTGIAQTHPLYVGNQNWLVGLGFEF